MEMMHYLWENVRLIEVSNKNVVETVELSEHVNDNSCYMKPNYSNRLFSSKALFLFAFGWQCYYLYVWDKFAYNKCEYFTFTGA